MQTIYKYPLRSQNHSLEMPKGAQILAVHSQGDIPTIWALVDSEAPLEGRHFITFGTGWEVKTPHGKRLSHVGTAITLGGLVWHVFEVLKA